MNPYQRNLKRIVTEKRNSKWEDAFAFQIKYHGLPYPETQYKFHKERKWRIDFAWPAHGIAVEVEGGIWRSGGGAHSHPVNIQRDVEKYNQLAIYGYRLFRISDREIKSGTGIELIKEAFKQEAYNHDLREDKKESLLFGPNASAGGASTSGSPCLG